jgi:hypothetical protein
MIAAALLTAAAEVAAQQPVEPAAASAPGKASAADAVTSPDETPTVSAIWLEQDWYQTHVGFTTYYNCDGLRDKVRWLLKQLAVREDLKVFSTGCTSDTGVEQFPRLRIKVASAVEATPERLAELEQQREQIELIAKVNEKRADYDQRSLQFAARKRIVQFRDKRGSPVEAGDCEFMETFADEVLPKIGARIVERDIRCTPHQVAMNSILLVVEVLEAAPPPVQ